MQFMLHVMEVFRLAGFTDAVKAIRGRVDREKPDE